MVENKIQIQSFQVLLSDSKSYVIYSPWLMEIGKFSSSECSKMTLKGTSPWLKKISNSVHPSGAQILGVQILGPELGALSEF